MERDTAFKKNSIWHTCSFSGSLPVSATEAGHFYVLPEYSVSRDHHDSLLLLFSVNGTGTVRTGDVSFTLPASHACLIDCRKRHGYSYLKGNWEFYWMHIKGPSLDDMSPLLEASSGKPVGIKDPAAFAGMFENLFRSMEFDNALNAMRNSTLVFSLLTGTAESTMSPGLEHSADSPARAAAEYINLHYAEDISVSELAAMFNVSEYHLIRTFKRIYGIPPYSYLLIKRISEAKKSLVMTDEAVSEIAAKCGFNDCAGFIACFKAHTGQTPLKYRKTFFYVR